MAIQYINVPENDFGRGIDARSTENQIGEGFVKDLLNADVIQKSVRKRTGYESYAGNIPVRVTRLDYILSKKQMCFTLDSVVSLNTTISLESVRSSPLVVYGRSSNQTTGPITETDSAHYYDKFLVPIRKEFVAPSGTLNIEGTEHGLNTTEFFCNVVESTQADKKDYIDVETNAIRIDSNTYDVNIDYDYTEKPRTDVIIYYKDEASSPGNNWIEPISHDGIEVTQTFNIPTTTHNLINYNIIYQLFEVIGSEWIQVKPDMFQIQPNGDVDIVISNDTGSEVNYKLIISASPTANIAEGNVNGQSSGSPGLGTAVISAPTSPWIFYNIYLTDPTNLAGPKEAVEADSVSYDEDTNEIVFSFRNNNNDARDFIIYYQYGNIRSNVLCVEDQSVTANGTDLEPQITLWGLDHDEIYESKSIREGWATHIDTYRRSGEQRVVTGLGGNLFSAQSYSEAAAEYLYARLYPSLQSRAAQALRVGPVFYDTGDEPARTRGYITTDIGGTGSVAVTAVAYDENTRQTKYTLDVPNMVITGDPISTTAGLEDWLTVSNMSYRKHEGTFRIRQVDDTVPHKLTIWVDNPENNSTDWDDNGTGGLAGIFTDQIEWLDTCKYIPGDTLILTGEDLAEVYLSDEETTVCGPFNSINEIAAGVLITGRRTSELVPMREALPSLADSVENLVRGDMLFYTGINRHLRVLSINPDIDRNVSITAENNIATVELTDPLADTSYLSPGQKILLIGAGNYSGVQTITSILSPTQFTFDTIHEDTVPQAILSGKTVEIDESLEWADTSGDTNLFQVARRWIPVEAPDDEYDLTPTTYVRHFDSFPYSAQPFIRSTMVSDNLYLTNGSDEVMKFDGQNIYRAGLPAWQPGLFATISADPATRDCSLSSGSTTVNVTGGGTTEGLELGVIVSGTHVPSGATIVSITSSTQFVISLPAVGGGNSSLSFTVPKKVVVNLRKLKHKGVPNYDSAFRTNILELNQVYEDGAIPVGSKVRINGLPTIYTIQSYIEKGGTAYIQFLENLDPAIDATDGIIEETGVYKYYFRLNAVDANDNIIASAMTSSDDMNVTISQDAAIRLKLVGMPVLGNYDYDRIEVEIYRTRLLTGSIAPVFYKVVTLGTISNPSVNFMNTTGYLEYVDVNADSDIALPTNLDPLSSQAGAELGIGWSAPLRGKYITTTSNRLVLGNVRDYPEFDIQVEGSTDLTPDIFNGNSVLFRRDPADTGPVTDMINRVKFQWVKSLGTVSSIVPGTNEFTITTATNTGASEGSWIYLTYDKVLTSGRDLKYSGWWQIKSCTSVGAVDTIKVNLQGASAAVSYPNRFAIASSNTKDVPVYLGTDGNLGQNNGDFLGDKSDKFDATRRLALAINSVMRMTDITLDGMETFRPWLLARSGNDVSRAGQIIVRAPYQTDILPSMEVDFDVDDYSVYVNTLAIESNEKTPARERVYPSRVLVSYENNPELFDTPTAILDADSISAIDINPADGQEITGVIPFFGEAAFTASQQAGILVVFKTNSIYLVDINQKVSGGNLVVQRLETQGLGCTAPYSIAVTRNGIMFANNSGIYCLRRNQTIEYIGKFMERNWTGRIEKNALSLAQGHHYGVGRMYKLSVPLSGTQDSATGYIEPSEVYVYNHSQEDEEQRLGAWSRYDNHTAIGWANLASDAFWASTGGKVYILRTTGSETDFRDSNKAITFRLDTRPNSYGNSGIRKIVNKILANYRAGTDTANNNLYFSVDLEQEYSETTPFRIAGTRENLTGIDDLVQKDVVTLTHNIGRRKGVYFSIRIENTSLDQNVEIAGLDYQIGGLNSEGIKTASET